MKRKRTRRLPHGKRIERRSVSMASQAKEEIVYGLGESSLGFILVAFGEKGVVSILTGDEPHRLVHDLEQRFAKAHLIHEDRDCVDLLEKITAYIESPARGLDLPLDIRGTAFQQRVWYAVRAIPLGETSSYSEIARVIGAPKAMRAVGTACANSYFSIAVPCHRVLRKNGSSSGGSFWGDDRHRILLEREASARHSVRSVKVGGRKGRRVS